MAGIDPTFAAMNPYGPESAELQRRRAMAQALLQMGLKGAPQGQMVSGHYVAPGPLSAALPLMQMFLGEKLQGDADKQQASMGQDFAASQAAALEKYMKMRQGQPAEPLPSGMAGPPNPPVEADPRGAAMAGISSPFPALQQIGKEDLTQINKNTLSPKDILGAGGADLRSRIAAVLAGGDVSKLQPQPEVKESGGRFYSITPGEQAKDVGGSSFSPLQTLGYDDQGRPIQGQVRSGSGEAKFAPRGGTTVNVNPGEKQFDKTSGEQRAKMLGESYGKAQKAVENIDTLKQVQTALESGIKSGFGADAKLAVAKAGRALGLSDDPSIVNTEQYRAQMANQVFAIIKNLGAGTGISDADRAYAEKAAGGQITLDDRTMARLVQVARQASMNAVLQHEDLLGRNRGAADPQELAAYELPFEFAAPDMTYDEKNRRFTLPQLGSQVLSPGTVGSARAAPGTVSFEDFVNGGKK